MRIFDSQACGVVVDGAVSWVGNQFGETSLCARLVALHRCWVDANALGDDAL